MTLVLGQQDQSDCDFCCICGLFCSNTPYCGRYLEFVLTHDGASDADPMICTTCADLNAAIATLRDGINVYHRSAAVWNSTFKPPGQAFDAKSGTTVCFWTPLFPDDTVSACSGSAIISSIQVATYYGTDNKWHMTYRADYSESSYTSVLSGDVEFSGGGAAMDCGEVGEGTPTFSLTIPLTEYDTSGTKFCNPPTSVLVEGNPQ